MEQNVTRTEQIISSLDGLSKAGAPDFFYTRLIGRMQQEPEPKQGFILKPYFITAALSVLFLVNILSFLALNGNGKEQGKEHKKEGVATIESFARAYGMNTESVYE